MVDILLPGNGDLLPEVFDPLSGDMDRVGEIGVIGREAPGVPLVGVFSCMKDLPRPWMLKLSSPILGYRGTLFY